MPGQNRYGYGRSQADYLDREYVPPYMPEAEGGDTTEATVVAAIIDAAIAEYETDYGTPGVTGSMLEGYLFAGADAETYPEDAAELATRYGKVCKALSQVIVAFGGYPSCNSNQPGATLPICVAAGTFAEYLVMADLLGVDGYPGDLRGNTYTPYISYVKSSTFNDVLTQWGNLSAHDSTYPVAVTPAAAIGWPTPEDGALALENWLDDLQIGSGTGAIYCSDV